MPNLPPVARRPARRTLTRTSPSRRPQTRPCSPVPFTPPPIPVPDAFPIQDTPTYTLPLAADFAAYPPPPPRPMLPHHGLSRSALQHQKWLWHTRYDEWMQWQAEVETAEAEASVYGGIVAVEPPPTRRTRFPSPSPSEPEQTPVSKKVEVNDKIFPRTGDLMALHDPQVARLDQTFCNFPLWTIQKVLFVCSMDAAAREKTSRSQEAGTIDRSNSIQDIGAPPAEKGAGSKTGTHAGKFSLGPHYRHNADRTACGHQIPRRRRRQLGGSPDRSLFSCRLTGGRDGSGRRRRERRGRRRG
ncbi:hypothetical protein BC834DRAFT_875609 [Gloeopeniophorella convolvens]|nr:hypothetical protein BC834DRAFT_875609 [Gloeopeniophorella convolvens]